MPCSSFARPVFLLVALSTSALLSACPPPKESETPSTMAPPSDVDKPGPAAPAPAPATPTGDVGISPADGLKTREKPLSDRVKKLLTGTALADATDEEKRIALRIAALQRVREEAQEVIHALPGKKAEAETLKPRIEKAEAALDNALVTQTLIGIRKRIEKEALTNDVRGDEKEDEPLGPGMLPLDPLVKKSRSVDLRLVELLGAEKANDDDSATVKELKRELEFQQQLTMKLASANRVAFRALLLLEQTRRALPVLEKLAADQAKAGQK